MERLSRSAIPVVWRVATVVGITTETPRLKTLLLDVPNWPGHVAGQHVDVRLTAEDGYQAQRSYSIASAPETTGRLELTVERLEDGEVSPYLVDELAPGDPLELRGPIGGLFAWSVEDGGPLMLLGGGSGVVPLMAMLRHRAAHGHAGGEARLLLSARRLEEVPYRAELEALAVTPGTEIHLALTRERPPGWTGIDRRVDREVLERVVFPPAAAPRVFVCGSNPFVEAVGTALVALGHDPAAIRTERFGPTA